MVAVRARTTTTRVTAALLALLAAWPIAKFYGDPGLLPVTLVIAGLVTGWHGRIRVTPTTWDSLVDMWAQLAFWASSLIFLLAAMLVPRLLTDATWEDALLLAILVPATLVARAIVLYGLLPLLAVAYPYALRGEDGRRNVLLFAVGSALVTALGIRAFDVAHHQPQTKTTILFRDLPLTLQAALARDEATLAAALLFGGAASAPKPWPLGN